MNTESTVPPRCLSLLVDPSRAGYFICVFNLSVANAPLWPVQIARTKPHGHHLDLNFALPYRAHFSPSSILIRLIPTRHILFASIVFPRIIIITSLSGPPGLFRHLQNLRWINIAFVSLPQKVNMRDMPNFSLFDTHAFYMIKEMKNSVIYTQSARPLFAPCLFYLKRYRVFLSLLKARRQILVAKATYIDSATINKALNNIVKVE